MPGLTPSPLIWQVTLALVRDEVSGEWLKPLQRELHTQMVVLASCFGGFCVSVTAFQVLDQLNTFHTERGFRVASHVPRLKLCLSLAPNSPLPTATAISVWIEYCRCTRPTFNNNI